MVNLDPEYFGNAMVCAPVENLSDGVYFDLWDGILRLGKGTEGLRKEIHGRVELLEGLLTTFGESFVTLFVKNGKVLVQHFFYAKHACWQVYFEPFADDSRAMGIVPRRAA